MLEFFFGRNCYLVANLLNIHMSMHIDLIQSRQNKRKQTFKYREWMIRAHFLWELNTLRGWDSVKKEGEVLVFKSNWKDLNASYFILFYFFYYHWFFIHSFLLFKTYMCHLNQENDIKDHVLLCQHNLMVNEMAIRVKNYIGSSGIIGCKE